MFTVADKFAVTDKISASIAGHQSVNSHLLNLLNLFKRLNSTSAFYIALSSVSRLHKKNLSFLEFEILFSFVIVYFVEECPKQIFNRDTDARDEIAHDPHAQFQKYEPGFLLRVNALAKLYTEAYQFFIKQYQKFFWLRRCEEIVFEHMQHTLLEIHKSLLTIENSLEKQLFYIGKGGFSKVYRYQASENESVVIKVSRKKDINAFEREKKAYVSLQTHPNITQFISYTIILDTCFLCLEYVDNGDLSQALRKKTIPVNKKIQIALDIAQALQFMHQKNIVHMDMKAENVLLTKDFRPKITDFGLALNSGEEIKVEHGTPAYMAPEIYIYCISTKYKTSVIVAPSMDMYSFAILLFELCFIGKLQDYWPEKLYAKNNRGIENLEKALTQSDTSLHTVYNGLNSEYAPDTTIVHEKLIGLVSEALHTNQKHRPSFGSVIETLEELNVSKETSSIEETKEQESESIVPDSSSMANIEDILSGICDNLAQCRAYFLGLFPCCSAPTGVTKILDYLANPGYTLEQKAQYLYEMALGRTKNCVSSMFRDGKTRDVYNAILDIFAPNRESNQSLPQKFKAFEKKLINIMPPKHSANACASSHAPSNS